MSYLVNRIVLFLGALCVLFLSVFISFRCGYSKGLEDAPRRFYSVDVSRALRDNPDFRNYVDGIYSAAYTRVLDSLVRTDQLVTLVGRWIDEHPGCQMKKERALDIDAKSAERVFFKGAR